jgi:hypothetical protein
MGAEIKPSPENGSHCFQIYHLVSLLYPNRANMPGHRELYIFNSAEATTKV